MSTKRTAEESSNDEQTTEGTDPVCQQQDNVKRAKLVSLSDTTLQDLPIELLECILVKVVAMEVKNMKLAKSVWKEKPDLVIDRLRTVCSQWNSICETKFFRNEIHRTLDRTAQEMIRLEILHMYPIQFPVFKMTAMKDEIFILCKPDGENYAINVHDYNNMAEVKDVIPLPGISPADIAGCPVSNCVYVLNMELELNAEVDESSKSDSVLRITKAVEHQFEISPWITDLKLSLLTVSVNGSLITLLNQERPNPTVVRIYAANGSLQHEVVLSPDVYGLSSVENVIQKSNENLVLLSLDILFKTHLIEIDTFGNLIRRFQSALSADTSVNFADIYGRILLTNWQCSFELLDSELNLLDVAGLQPHEAQIFIPSKLHFNSTRNEIMSHHRSPVSGIVVLAIFRFV